MPFTDVLAKNLSKNAAKNVKAWLEQPKYSEYRKDLVEMIETEKWKDLEDAFFKEVEFGTGGRRGTTGVGSNRINRVTIGESAQALCIYAAENDKTAPGKGVVIACDTRLTSPELSRYTAQVCAANGFKVYLFNSFRSTPELSFAVRHLNAAIGIVISASHNPPLDNGFKAYWSDGGQLVAPHDHGVISTATGISSIHSVDFDQAALDGKIQIIGNDVDESYIAAVVGQAEGSDRDLKIVYSPLHGAGQVNTLPALRAAGFEDISLVEDQMTPDGNFPTIAGGKANPEEKEANDRAVAQLLAENADIAITNDPDSDRIGVIVREGDDAVYLSGNQSAALSTDYALRRLRDKGTLTRKHYIAKTIVTTDMLNAIADSYGATTYGDMLVGFKYIGELILSKEETDEIFVIGGEESYGLLKGDYARDKDGAVGALVLAEFAAELKKDNKTLNDRLNELFVEHGLFVERLESAYFYGATGFETMQNAMAKIRTSPPEEVGGHKITAVLDYSTLKKLNIESGDVSDIECLNGNVVVLELDGDSRKRITIRPSGTEPKLKFYIQWYDQVENPANIQQQRDSINHHLQSVSKKLEGALLEA